MVIPHVCSLSVAIAAKKKKNNCENLDDYDNK